MSAWPTTEAIIHESELRRSDDSYNATARYSYSWEGTHYEGYRVALSRTADNIGDFQEETAGILKAAKVDERPLPVHVNPENPSESILFPQLRWELVGFLGVFGLVFFSVGFGIMMAGLLGGRNARKNQTLSGLHPNEPWLQDEKWASGEIRSGGKGMALGLTLFAVVWTLISTPALFAFHEEFFIRENRAILFALIFPLVGLGLLAAAIYLWIRYLKYGQVTLQLQTLPGVIGGSFSGAIVIPKTLIATEGVRMALRCQRHVVSGSGKNRSVRVTDLWSHEEIITDQRRTPTGGTLLPVLFQIPYECHEVDTSNESNKVQWKLEATAATPGVDFHAEFDVPVFRTAESDPDYVVPKQAEEIRDDRVAQERLWQEEHVQVQPGLNGSTQLRFPMMRHKGYSFAMLAFAIIWNSIVAVIFVYTEAPILFPLIGGLLGVLILLGTLHSCFSSQTLNLQKGSLELRCGLFGAKGPYPFTMEELKTLELAASSQSGNVSFYTLRLRKADGKKQALVPSIKGKQNAERLQWMIEEICGVPREEAE